MAKESTSHPNLSAALAEAQNIVEAAEKRAKQLVEDAELVQNEAEERGYQDGLERGKDDAASSAIRLIEERAALSERIASEAAKLALSISSSIIGEHVRLNPETVQSVALRALRESVIGESAAIIVHPQDLPALEEAMDDLQQIAGEAELELQTDRSMASGGCIVRTDFGEVDASIESLLGAIATRLGISKNGR